MDGAADDVTGGFIEVVVKQFRKLQILLPQDLIEELALEADHHGGRVIDAHLMAKHFKLEITDDTFTWHRDEEKIRQEAAIDGIYVVRTSLQSGNLSASDRLGDGVIRDKDEISGVMPDRLHPIKAHFCSVRRSS